MTHKQHDQICRDGDGHVDNLRTGEMLEPAKPRVGIPFLAMIAFSWIAIAAVAAWIFGG